MRRHLIAALAALLTVLPAAAGAHHGFAMFDTTRPQYFEGRILEVYWSYPHAYVRIRQEEGVTIPDALAPGRLIGELAVPENLVPAPAREWTMFVSAYWRLERKGFTGDALRVNDTFRAIAFPSCEEEHDAEVALIMLSHSQIHWVAERLESEGCRE